MRIGEYTSKCNLPQLLLGILITVGVIAVLYSFTHFGFMVGVAVSMIPLMLCALFYCIKKPSTAMFGMLIINYFLMYLSRYSHGEIPVGTLLDAAILFNILVLLLYSFTNRVEWRNANSGLTIAALIWSAYCTLEVFNPVSVSSSAWVSSVRSLAFNFLAIVILTQIIFSDKKYLRYIFLILSILTLIAVAKALIQKYIGFDAMEKVWLYQYGGATTHILSTSIRYFSIYSDAANFGAGMGLAMVVFSIYGLSVENHFTKYYYIAVSIAACYGLLISGTRSALAVPFAGYTALVLLSKKPKVIIVFLTLMLGTFLFLKYTNIGQGNSIVRRARSAFNPDDPSLLVRLENQKKIKTLMVDKPFGYGIGLGGGKAKEYAPNAPISQIPTDSWFVMIWVETGVVGLVLHISILLYVIFYGAYLSLFKLKSPSVKWLTVACVSGIVGIVVMSYANEVLGQIPNGLFVYLCMGLIFLAPIYDRQMLEKQKI